MKTIREMKEFYGCEKEEANKVRRIDILMNNGEELEDFIKRVRNDGEYCGRTGHKSLIFKKQGIHNWLYEESDRL